MNAYTFWNNQRPHRIVVISRHPSKKVVDYRKMVKPVYSKDKVLEPFAFTSI